VGYACRSSSADCRCVGDDRRQNILPAPTGPLHYAHAVMIGPSITQQGRPSLRGHSSVSCPLIYGVKPLSPGRGRKGAPLRCRGASLRLVACVGDSRFPRPLTFSPKRQALVASATSAVVSRPTRWRQLPFQVGALEFLRYTLAGHARVDVHEWRSGCQVRLPARAWNRETRRRVQGAVTHVVCACWPAKELEGYGVETAARLTLAWGRCGLDPAGGR